MCFTQVISMLLEVGNALSLSLIVSKGSSMFLKDAMRRGVIKGLNFFDLVIISHLLIVVVIIIFLYILQGHVNGNQQDLFVDCCFHHNIFIHIARPWEWKST